MAKVDYATLKKGGFMRQKQKNNFSLRLACVGGALTAENLKKIAEVAEKYGDGYVHLTSRQGVEIPFITLLKSSFKSSISSIPTLIRIISSYTPESSFSSCVRCAAIVLDGCIASVFVSPIFDTSHGILSSFRIRKARSLLPVLNVMIAPYPPWNCCAAIL